MRIIFMGTPDFAVPSLECLIESGHQVLLVVTQPDKPKGRGNKLSMPAVKKIALQHQIEVFQPHKLHHPDVLEKLSGYQADLMVVVAYGKILSRKVLNIPKYGCVNVHASLLPFYRGAAPIQWAIVKGEKVTGITTMLMTEELDAGNMLVRKEVEIMPDMTGGDLHDQLCCVGAKALIETLETFHHHIPQGIPQDHSKSSYAPMLQKQHGLLDWSLKSVEIHNRVRGFSPFPGAFTYYKEKKMRIWKSSITSVNCLGTFPGTIMEVSPEGILVASGDYALKIEEVQFDSCRRMCVSDYLCGNRIAVGTILGVLDK